MKWIRYTLGGKASYGILENQRVTGVESDPFDGYEKTGEVFKLADMQLEVPVVPPTFYCVGLNYVKHIGKEGKNIPTHPAGRGLPREQRTAGALSRRDHAVGCPICGTATLST